MVGVRIIDREKLQMIQNLICSFVGVSGVMLDKNRTPLSRISNDYISGNAISQLIGSEYLDQMIDNVRDDSPEDICIQSIEDSEDGMIRVGVVSIKPAGRMFMTALVAAPGAFRSDKFSQFLDFLSHVFCRTNLSLREILYCKVRMEGVGGKGTHGVCQLS